MTVVSYIKQQPGSALQKKMVLFRNLLGKGLTQEINGREASSDELLIHDIVTNKTLKQLTDFICHSYISRLAAFGGVTG